MEIIVHNNNESKKRNLPSLVTTPYSIDPLRRKIDNSNFIYIPQKKTYISINPFDMTNQRLNWEESHYFLADRGLFMPNIASFMTHYKNLRDASQGRKDLYLADGTELSISGAYSLWHDLNKFSRDSPSCYTWLDNSWRIKKVEDNNEEVLIMSSDHKIKRSKEGLKLKGKEKCVNIVKSEFRSWNKNTTLHLDDFGLPTEWVSEKDCALGVTIEFSLPVDGRATEYRSGIIDCSKDQMCGPTMLYYCAYSEKNFY